MQFLCSEKPPYFGVDFRPQIPCKSLTRLSFSAIILRYKGGQSQADTPKFRTNILTCFLTNKFKNIIMNKFKVEGDLGRHHLSISGACAECGISTSTINREQGKTFPPKVKLSEKRIGFLVYQVEEWLQGARGGWA